MATSVIPISSALSNESVGSPLCQIILFGAIPAIIPVIPEVPAETHVIPPVAPMVGMTIDTALTRWRDLIPYSDSDLDSSDVVPSPEYISLLLATSPFVCTDFSKTSGDSSDGPPSQHPYEVTIARWRGKVASRPSPSDGFPLALIAAPPGFHRRPTILIQPRQAIPFGRPYHTHPNGPWRALTARKRTHLRIHHQIHFNIHPATLDDSSAPPRFVYPPPARTLQDSDAYRRSRSSPLSTISPAAMESIKEDIDADVLADIEAHTVATEAAIAIEVCTRVAVSVGVEVDTGLGMGIEVGREDKEEYKAELSARGTFEIGVDRVIELVLGVDVAVQQLYDHMHAVLINRIRDIEAGQRQLIMTNTRFRRTRAAIEEMINRRMAEVLEAYEANKNLGPIVESDDEHGNGDGNRGGNSKGDGNGGDNGNGGVNDNGNGNDNGGGIGNINGRRNENHDVNERGVLPVTRECTYQDFMKCQPLNFKGTDEVVGLIRWFEKMETMFHISNCPEKYQVKYAMCTLLNNALTYWNSHKQTIRTDAAFAMSWRELLKQMTEEDRVKRFIGGLLDNIQGNVIAAEPTRLQDAVRVANNLMDQKLKGYARAQVGNPRAVTCFECGVQGHFKKDCPKLKNQNRGNKNGIGEARGKAYVLGGGDTDLNANVLTGMFLLKDRYASMLFDTDRSFVSNTFSALLGVILSTQDASYAVELADGRIVVSNTILRGCTLGLLGHPFDIDLMPVELGSFDVIIRMDWLAKYHAVIVCAEKLVRIPYGNKVLIFQGDGSEGGNKSRLSIISCTKTQKYNKKGYQVFLAHVTKKNTEDKSEEKRLEDVPTVRDFLKVFP
ncbi:reverse transcriptase domain-containing protein [Tanacetum coccineum]